MNKLDIKELKESQNIVDVVNRWVSIEKKGSEYYGICPFHKDEKSSLQVNEKKQIFKCFACGAGGDAIDFVEKFHNVETSSAIKILNGTHPANTTEPNKKTLTKKPKPVEFKQIETPESEPENFTHYKHGEPQTIWTYRNEDSSVYGYTCRFDLEDGTKQVLPYCQVTDGKTIEWRFKGFNVPRKLYNADRIVKSGDKSVIIIVEGEKTADAGNKYVGDDKHIFTTWTGGANVVNRVDWSILKGKKVLFIPDHDTEQKDANGKIKEWYQQAGNSAMLEIAAITKDFVSLQKWVFVPDSYVNKWDIADKEWKKSELKQFIKDNINAVPVIPTKPIKKPKKKTAEKKPTKKKPLTENDYFRFLGYDKDENQRLVYFFFSFEAKSVIRLAPSAMTKTNLLMLAPFNFWEFHYGGGKGQKIDMDAVQQYLVGTSHKTGMFQDKFIRGRGAWLDNDNIVIHEGSNIIENGKKTPLREYKSRYVYEIGENFDFGYENPLPKEDAHKIIEFMNFLRWERQINAYLLAGWCVLAPFCGVLSWRPHIWLTGPSGSGKSWVMENIVKRLMADTAVVVQGKTTEAGIRGTLQSDARPVLFDESDIDSQHDKERIQSILGSARSASYSDGGGVVKGTQTGTSRSYTIRSMFAFSSIGVHVNQQSDRSRFTTLGLVPNDAIQTKEQFKTFMKKWAKVVDDDFVHRLHARTLKLMPVILENTKTFADAASHVIGNKRLGDQVGSMLAGAYSLSSSKIISLDDAIIWVETKDWSEEKGLDLTKDEVQLWNLIISQPLKVESSAGYRERNIGELILIAANYSEEDGISVESAHNCIKRVGVMIYGNDKILISNTSPGLKKILSNTSWPNNHNKIIERLEGAEKVEPRRFYPGHSARSVSVPLDFVRDKEEKTPTNEEMANDILFDED